MAGLLSFAQRIETNEKAGLGKANTIQEMLMDWLVAWKLLWANKKSDTKHNLKQQIVIFLCKLNTKNRTYSSMSLKCAGRLILSSLDRAKFATPPLHVQS